MHVLAAAARVSHHTDRVWMQLTTPICEAKISMQIMTLQIFLVLLLLHVQLRAHGRGHVCQGAIVTGELGEVCTQLFILDPHRQIGLPLLTKRQREGVVLF